MASPYFSIILPTYNREKFLPRAIDSVLAQSFDNYEVIVIDDGSMDLTEQVVMDYNDKKIKYLKHTVNKGPCPARNYGIRDSIGSWLIMLDSDKSLLPNALEYLYQRSCSADDQVGNLASSILWDNQNISPFPRIPNSRLNYFEYLKWLNTISISEYFNCIRREVFNEICYPESRAWEAKFHLDLASKWILEISQNLIAMEHTDAPNRLTNGKGKQARQRILEDANDQLKNVVEIQVSHGDAIKQLAPNRYQTLLRDATRFSFLSGKRGMGINYAREYLQFNLLNYRFWLTLFCGMVSPKLLASVIVLSR